MKNKIIRITSMLMFIVLVTTAFVGCGKKETYDNYSYGLNADGVYENLSSYPCSLPDFTQMNITCEEVLEWGLETVTNEDENIKTVDDYVYRYGQELLATLELTQKEIAEAGDILSISLKFYIDGKLLENYVTTGNYEASTDGDSIVKSLIGHKKGDVYEISYTFPEDTDEYASQTATVEITINSVMMGDPIKEGVVEANLEKINEHVKNVTDVESYLKNLRPILADVLLESYLENYLQTMKDITTPNEYIEYELYRLKARLAQIGYKYKDYLEEMKMTDEEVRVYCEMVAKENYISMLIYNTISYKVTEDDINSYFGENREYIESVQGLPYMKLTIIRGVSLMTLAERVTLLDDDGNPIRNNTTEDSSKENESSDTSSDTTKEEISDTVTGDTVDATEVTKNSTIGTPDNHTN